MPDIAALLPVVEQLARAAGESILTIYASDFAVRGKADASPVTAADEAAERCIVAGLQALQTGWPIVAEEAVACGQAPVLDGGPFWLVDPLDGTREFIARNGEFTVNIALVVAGRPLLGVVLVPVAGRLYAGFVGPGDGQGQGAWLEDAAGRRPIRCRPAPAAGVVMACSRSHGDDAALAAWLQVQHRLHGLPPVLQRVAVGSSLKFGLLAAGLADIYPRLGRTMEWDTAAGEAVLRAAGGRVTDLAGAPLRYGKAGFENPHFVARGAAARAA